VTVVSSLFTVHPPLYLPHVSISLASRLTDPAGLVARVGRWTTDAARALADVATWRPLLLEQMRRLGVDSVPIAIFIAVFTGIVLALLSSYIFTGAVPLYFVGALVGKTVMIAPKSSA